MVKLCIIPIHHYTKSCCEVGEFFDGDDWKSCSEHSICPMTLLKWDFTCCVVSLLTELPGAWNQAGCEGLGREGWGMALGGDTGGGTALRGRLGGEGKNSGGCKGEGRRNGRRGGTKAVSSTAATRDKSWPLTSMSYAKELRELQRGRARRPLPFDCSPLNPISSSFSTHFHSHFTSL